MTTTYSAPGPQTPVVPAESWRDRLKVTRSSIFSLLFVLFGVWMLVTAPAQYTPQTITTLTFGSNLPNLIVPTEAYVIGVAVLYLMGGALGLLHAFRAQPVVLAAGQKKPRRGALENLVRLLLAINGILIIPTVLIIVAAGGSTNVTVMMQVSIRLATPVVLGALAGIWCERAGVVNIAIEGMMLTGACFGFVAMNLLVVSGIPTATSLWLGVLVAVISGGIMSLLHAWLSIRFRTDQIVSGTVINILAVGITSFVRREVLLSSEAGRETLQNIPIPGLSSLPVIGDVLFNGRPVFYAMFILLVVTHVVLFHTRFGLRMRAVGENPHAADTLGIDVIRIRWIAVFVGGLIAGLAGAWFSLETTGSFDDNMTSGRGFIALAAMIFGKYTPIGSFAGGLLFGFSDALGQRFQFLGVPIPPQFLQMVPYIITIVVLAGLVGKATAPKADGVPYEKEH
jgi:simple sugar transport system permease protein